MKRVWLAGLVAGIVVGTTVLGVTSDLFAQNRGAATDRSVASIDVGLIFSEYQKKKDLDEEMKSEEERLNQEIQSRKDAIDSYQATVDALDTSDPTYIDKVRGLLSMQINFKNWMEMTQADMTRELALWTTRIYSDINDMTADVAQREGLDVVLFHNEFRPAGLDPQVIQEQIANRKVVYVSPGADVTQLVLDTLNAKYRSQPRPQRMIQMHWQSATPAATP